MRIACLAFEEAQNRAAHGGDIWHARAREAQRVRWWLQAMGHVTVTLKDGRKEGDRVSWADARTTMQKTEGR